MENPTDSPHVVEESSAPLAPVEDGVVTQQNEKYPSKPRLSKDEKKALAEERRKEYWKTKARSLPLIHLECGCPVICLTNYLAESGAEGQQEAEKS